MAKMTIAIGLGQGGDGEDDLSEYEMGARDMRDRCCALAEMYDSGKKPGMKLSKLIDRLPLDERAPSSRPSGAGAMSEGEDGYGED